MQTRRYDICKVPGFPFTAGSAAQKEYGYVHGHPLIRPYYVSSFPVRYYYWKKLRLICSLFDFDRHATVLDIGCGPGILLPTLANFFDKVTALDINKDDVEIADRVCGHLGLKNVSLYNVDMAAACLPEKSIDVAFSIDVFEHIKDLSPTIKNMYRAMKDGGLIVVSAPTENAFNDIARRVMGFSKPDTHYHSSIQIKEMLEHDFRLIKRKRLFRLPRAISPAEVFLFMKRS
jgi:2-polyprenyl-3-methyl-5-hydroxy-6-metoxy-1,4-benzoquinol methylase